MKAFWLTLFCLLMTGCAGRAPILPHNSHLPERVELADTPFFPQREYQCGPAALATLLTHRGIAIDPEALRQSVYLPGREGSLQVELVAAARAEGLLAYPLEPTVDALFEELASGNPVLVLQDLGLGIWPQWHFAVVIGYDLDRQVLLLRSGTTERLEMGFRHFLATWEPGERWAVVVVSPDQLPATAVERKWLLAASDLEQVGQTSSANRAYRVATERWPGTMTSFAHGNSEYLVGNDGRAAASFIASLRADQDFHPAWFNLANVLAEVGCRSASEKALHCARTLAPQESRYQDALKHDVPESGREPICDVSLPACPVVRTPTDP